MAILTFNGVQYEVDYAVKGADYINGYDANGAPVVCIAGIVDFDAVSYDGEYMAVSACPQEPCNDIMYAENRLKKRNGSDVTVYPEQVGPGRLAYNILAKEALTPSYSGLRNISAGTEDKIAGSDILLTGNIYLVYE